MIKAQLLSDPDLQADWAEAVCLFKEERSLSRFQIANELEQASYGDVEVETVLGNILREVSWRHSAAPNAHPIEVSEGRLQMERSWKNFSSYSFMLLLSLLSSFYEGSLRRNWHRTAKLFERLVSEALLRYLGGAINIGYPRGSGVPRNFAKCLEYVCNRIREQPGITGPYSRSTKDEGVDVISWRPFDSRSGQVLLLVQCTAGENWRRKAMEISVRVWRDYINFVTDPITALAFPQICNNRDDWMYHSHRAGLLLDRLRIARCIPAWCRMREDLNEWSEAKLPSLKEILTDQD